MSMFKKNLASVYARDSITSILPELYLGNLAGYQNADKFVLFGWDYKTNMFDRIDMESGEQTRQPIFSLVQELRSVFSQSGCTLCIQDIEYPKAKPADFSSGAMLFARSEELTLFRHNAQACRIIDAYFDEHDFFQVFSYPISSEELEDKEIVWKVYSAAMQHINS